MENYKKVKDVLKMVEEIMRMHEQSRNSDDILFLLVCEKIERDVTFNSLYEVFTHRREHGIPTYESVSRARRKLQRKYPELQACEEVADERERKAELYEVFMKG